MKFKEWKKQYNEKCNLVFEKYKEIVSHLENVDNIEDDFDEEEYHLCIILGQAKLQKNIKELFEDS